MSIKSIMNQLYGSSAHNILNQRASVRNPIDMKLEAIGHMLDESDILNFRTSYDPRRMIYNYRVKYEGNYYYDAISEEVMRYADTKDIVAGIAKLIMFELSNPDPEYQFENENEQAMLDAAMDYGFI